MTQRSILILSAIFGMLAVAIGAFGAHGLKSLLLANGRTETFELAVRYQFYHALALLGMGILSEKWPALKTPSLFFVAGILIFSGSLYFLSLTNQTWLGAITPLGGVAFIAGWLGFLWVVWKKP